MDLTTERLVLRSVTQGDAAWVTREISNPNVHRWLSSPPHPYGLSDAQTWIARICDDPLYRLICYQGERAGLVSLTDRGPHELGYWLAQFAWGKGIMTEAANALVAFFFDTADAKIRSGYLDGNVGSKSVLQKLGFTDIGTRMDHFAFHGREMPVHRVELAGRRALQAPSPRATRDMRGPQ